MWNTKNDGYWQKRMTALEDNQYRCGAAYYKDVQNQFREASNSIQLDINQWYQRLADNNNVSYAGAKRLLKKNELDEFHWNVDQYIKAGEENAIDQRWMKELENASARHHISYLEAMKLQTQQHAELLSAQFDGSMTDYLKKSYGDDYYHTAFELAKGTGTGTSLAKLDNRKVDAIIRKPWAQDGANFSDRIWSNKEKLVNNLHTELSQNIIRGSSPQQAIDSLKNTMEVSRRQAGRLIMTESAAISSAAQKDCFKDLGVEQYEIVATLDSLTSKICRDMDGKVFDMKDYKVGETAPPFHPNCRSTTVPHFDDEFTDGDVRAARDEETGKTYFVPADMKYGEWEEKYVDSDGRNGIMESEHMPSASLRFVSNRDDLYRNAAKVVPLEGYEDIVCHADPDGFAFIDPDTNEMVQDVTAEELANKIKGSGRYHGGNIRLMACQAGAKEGGVAQQVADLLGVDVLAPSETLYIASDGTMFVTDYYDFACKGISTGEWKLFKPKGGVLK